MAADYQQILDPTTGALSSSVKRTADGAFIPNDPGNRDWGEYEAWLAEGNKPDPPDPLPTPAAPPPDPNTRLDAGIAAAAAVMAQPPPPAARTRTPMPGPPASQAELDALWARVDQLQLAMGDMLRAQDVPRITPARR